MSYASRTMSSDLVPRPGSGVIDSPVIDGGQEKGDVIGSMEAASFTTDQPYRFIGNELYADNGLGLYDFKARLYDPATGRFLSVDPLAEKYAPFGTYGYCGGNPMNFVDPNGEETYVYDNQNGKYSVAGGKLNGNRNIYVVDSNNEFVRNERGRSISIGKSMTPVSFYNFKTKSWGNETIDLKNTKGQDFINELTTSMIPLGDYMERAKEYQVYDFKHTDGSEDERREDVLRGMPITQGGATYIASARDIGNYVAGYYAGANGFGWMASRIAFDLYQGGIEGIQTQMAQFLGWKTGSDRIAIVKHYNLLKSAPSLFIFCKKWFQR